MKPQTKQALEHDQGDRDEESMSDYDSAEEEVMAIPRDSGGVYYVTDIEDSGSDYEYLWDDEAYVAGRQADYALYKASWDEIRALQPTMGRGIPDSSDFA